MCGIVGFVNNDKKTNKDKIIKKMADKIIHRGPDSEGYYTDGDIALGHRRLSIIDLSNGLQPMFNEDENLVVIFNGEIYNFKELKKDLKNHKFKTNCDTEVLLHGYEEYGEELPKKLRGMFAFVIWDKKKKKLFGARDHFGIKPFYYAKFNDTFMFASEIKALMEHPDFKKELNKDILGPYLSFSFVPTDETFFKGVNRLSAGEYFTYENNCLSIKKYFDVTFDATNEPYDTYVKRISDIMKDSVAHHMISDVEVGSFLSSGIDSSYIVSLAKPDKTYTVGYENKKYDEISYAKDLTNRLGITNHSKIISKDEFVNIVPKIMYHMDEPVSDPAAIALYFVAKEASKDVKVVLSGEGADEFFGGYNMYRQVVDASFYNKVPFFIRHAISNVCKLLPEVKGVNFLIRRGDRLEDSYVGMNRIYSDKQVKQILKTRPIMPNREVMKEVYELHKNDSDLDKMQAVDINYWLMKDILGKADRMTMANSIEGRVPFTDIEVFNVARTLPFSAKVTKENTKVALRDAAKEVIPNESYKKKKLGFPVPIREWMKEDDLYNKVMEALDTPIAQELFNTKQLKKMMTDHKNGKKDNYRKVWTIYAFIVWYQVFFLEQYQF